MSGRSIAFIASSSAAGQELMAEARVLAERVGYSFRGYTTPPQTTAVRVMARDDVTILDATIESGGGSAYPSFSAQPFVYDHVLTLSRVPLPLNFHGLRTCAPPRLHAYDNRTLLGWVDEQLTELAGKPRRSAFQRTLIGASANVFLPSNLVAVSPAVRHHAFVSYRREALDQARDLAAELRAGRFPETAGPADVTFLEPGEIAYDDEILTAQLRWHMISLLSERIQECQSIWICDSPGYAGSWWTRVELVLWRYFTYSRDSGKEPRLQLYRFQPADGSIDQPSDLIQPITYEQKRGLDRIISNTGSTMPADTVARSRELAELPLFRKSPFWNDRVFSEEFARVPLLDTGQARPAPRTLSAAVVQSTINLDDERLIPIPPDVLAVVEDQGSARFSGFRVYRDRHQGERYLWYPVRMGRPTAPRGSLDDTLASLPVYRAVQE